MKAISMLAAVYLDALEQLAATSPGVEDRVHDIALEMAKRWPTLDTPSGEVEGVSFLLDCIDEDLRRFGGTSEGA